MAYTHKTQTHAHIDLRGIRASTTTRERPERAKQSDSTAIFMVCGTKDWQKLTLFLGFWIHFFLKKQSRPLITTLARVYSTKKYS